MSQGKTKTAEKFDVVSHIIEFEGGTLDAQGTLDLFCHLIKTGKAWSLQGAYGRAAHALIEQGIVSKEGEPLVTAAQWEAGI